MWPPWVPWLDHVHFLCAGLALWEADPALGLPGPMALCSCVVDTWVSSERQSLCFSPTPFSARVLQLYALQMCPPFFEALFLQVHHSAPS